MDSLLTMPDYKLVLEVSVNGMCSRSRWCFWDCVCVACFFNEIISRL